MEKTLVILIHTMVADTIVHCHYDVLIAIKVDKQDLEENWWL